ncbi:MAG: anti-sigma regulatory factor [Acidobacteriota bacterium]|nr:anti-sigma regulatory factor [Acidobacteriota bacterium]
MDTNKSGAGTQAIPIFYDTDVVEARAAARTMASRVGFMGTDLVLIASAVSEIARNIVEYTKGGEVILSVVQSRSTFGLQVIARDQGPGIADLSLAMKAGYSTSRSLGLGLPGSRRLMDEFRVESTLGSGTTVTMRKWLA